MDPFQVHDLLRIDAPGCLRGDNPRPDWVGAALIASPWVVVRRTPAEGRLIAVGVRGAVRAQRWAAWLSEDDVIARLKPEALTSRLADLAPERLSAAPAFAAATAMTRAWRDMAAAPIWGPTGSVGFELASGQPTANAASDLDAIIRCPSPVSVAQARAWLSAFTETTAPLCARVDVLLETPQGAVALLDYARAAPPAMLRTDGGPRLVDDPWADFGVAA